MSIISNIIKSEKNRKILLKATDDVIDEVVKIQGTKYDRKRRYTDKDKKKWESLYKKGKTFYQIAKMWGADPRTIRYAIDVVYRVTYNARRSGLHTGITTMDKPNRASYKRTLIAKRKIKEYGDY